MLCVARAACYYLRSIVLLVLLYCTCRLVSHGKLGVYPVRRIGIYYARIAWKAACVSCTPDIYSAVSGQATAVVTWNKQSVNNSIALRHNPQPRRFR